MTVTEFRAWVTVPGITADSDTAGRLLDSLTDHHGDLGPVLAGTAQGVQVVLATEVGDEAEAARALYSATADALRRIGLADCYPTAVEIEHVT